MNRSKSDDLFQRALQRIPGGVNSPVRAFRGVGGEPFFVERANGSRIWDVDGNEFIDYIGTWGPAILGHAPQVVIDAIFAAAKNGVSFGIPNPFEVVMAEGSKIAAVILEPIPANAGLYFPQDGFLELLRQQCSQYGALLIFDEVMTGFRVARGGAQELFGIQPDLTALGKIIGGGLPVGAFGGRAEIMDELSPDGPVYQAGTLSGNPLAMAAGLAQLRELERINGWKLLEELGAQFEKLTLSVINHAKVDATFNRIGSMFCLFFASGPIVPVGSAPGSPLKMFAKFFHGCLKRGIYFAPSQFETGFISTAHTPKDIEQTATVVRESLRSL